VNAPAQTYRHFILNVFASAVGRMAAIVLAIVLATVFVRRFGVAHYGTWSFFFVLIGYWSLLDFGLSVAVERRIALASASGDRDGIARVLNVALTIAVGISLVAQAALWWTPATWADRLGERGEVERCLLVLPLCLLFSNIGSICGAALSGLQQMAALNALRTTVAIATTATLIGLVMAGVDRLDLLLVTSAAGLLVSGAIAWRLARRTIGPLRVRVPSIDRAIVRELLWIGGSVQGATLAFQAGDQLFRLLLTATYGPAAMGTYDLAVRGAIGLRSLAASLLTTMVPFGVGEHVRGGREALADLHGRAVRYVALFMIAGTIAAYLQAADLLHVWLGPAGAEGHMLALFRMLLVAHFVQTMASPAFMIGRALGRITPELIASLVGNTAGLAIAWTTAFGPGPVAAVVAFASSQSFAYAAGSLTLQRAIGIRPGRPATMVKLVAIAAATTAAAWLIGRASELVIAWAAVRLALVVAVACTTTAAAAAMTGLVRPDERRVWFQMARGRADAR
jgi:O-antigen/teichoic acid export membrane protein